MPNIILGFTFTALHEDSPGACTQWYIPPMSLPLSVLDLSPLSAGSSGAQAIRNSVDLARHADGLGFHRYWVSEHHNLPSVVSSSPEVLIGHLAGASQRMRVGSGGIMLPNHAPLRIAEAFRVLEALHPGPHRPRPGPRAGLRRPRAWRCAGDARERRRFPRDARRTPGVRRTGTVCRRQPDSAPCAPCPTTCRCRRCGFSGRATGGRGSRRSRGFGYAFAHHFSAEWVYSATRAYKEGFRPSFAPGRLETAAPDPDRFGRVRADRRRGRPAGGQPRPDGRAPGAGAVHAHRQPGGSGGLPVLG